MNSIKNTIGYVFNKNEHQELYKKPDGYKNLNTNSYITLTKSNNTKRSYLKSCSVS